LNKNNFSTAVIKEKNKLSSCTDLVVRGKNFPSLVGIGRLTKVEREMINLPPFQYSIIVGLLLSDG
jgi:hypothetical protein